MTRARHAASDKVLYARLKARQLALLVALYDQRSLRKAASEVAISQPAATKMLHELEDAFGAPLFVRHAWGMEPTLYGEALTRYARGMLTDIREAREEVAALAAGTRGKLRVGAVTGAVPSLLVPALRTVQASAPDLRVFLIVNSSEVLANALRDGTLDVGIGPPLAPAQATGIAIEAISREPLCVVARPTHPLARALQLTWRDIDKASWILQPPGSALRHSVDALFTRRRIAPGGSLVETVSIVATLALLQSRDALAVLPFDLARHYERTGLLVRLALPAAGGTEYMLMRRGDRELSPAATAFIAALRDVVCALPRAATARRHAPRRAAGVRT